MTSTADRGAVVAALREALDARAADMQRPGQLRLHLEQALGPDEARRLRPQVHQVVAAAQENLPADLLRIAPLTAAALRRLSSELAAARGWSTTTAEGAVSVWVEALGLAVVPESSGARPAAAVPQASLAPTLLPPALASAWLPAASARTGSERWPPPPEKVRGITQAPSGAPVLSAAIGFAGISLVLYAALVVVLIVVLCVPVLVLGGRGGVLPLLGIGLSALLASRLKLGALLATVDGVEFLPYADRFWRRPLPQKALIAPWSSVQVREGLVSKVTLDDRRVQVTSGGRAFAQRCRLAAQEAS